jgi:hypothetical protein
LQHLLKISQDEGVSLRADNNGLKKNNLELAVLIDNLKIKQTATVEIAKAHKKQCISREAEIESLAHQVCKFFYVF